MQTGGHLYQAMRSLIAFAAYQLEKRDRFTKAKAHWFPFVLGDQWARGVYFAYRRRKCEACLLGLLVKAHLRACTSLVIHL